MRPRESGRGRDESLPAPLSRAAGERAAALQAALRISPQASARQIAPTELALTLVYTTGSPRSGFTARVRRAMPSDAAGWRRRFPGEREAGQGAGKPF